MWLCHAPLGLCLDIHKVQPEGPFDLCEIRSATLKGTARGLTWHSGTTPRNARVSARTRFSGFKPDERT